MKHFLLTLSLFMALSFEALAGERLPHAPAYKDPLITDIYTITDNDTSDNFVEVQKNAETPISYSIDVAVEINVPYDRNAIIDLPSYPLKLCSLRVNGGYTVETIGGEIQLNKDADANCVGAYWVGGVVKESFVEGVLIEGGLHGQDGFNGGAWGSQTDGAPNYIFQNVNIRGIKSKNGTHADCLQMFGAVGKLAVHNAYCETHNQGIFLDPQVRRGSQILSNVSIVYASKLADGYGLFLNDSNENPYGQPTTVLEDVYVDKRDLGPFENYSVAPAAHWSNGTNVVRAGNEVCFPDNPEIFGCVKIWRGEDFISNRKIGVNYVSPGYTGKPTKY